MLDLVNGNGGTGDGGRAAAAAAAADSGVSCMISLFIRSACTPLVRSRFLPARM